MNVFLVPKKKLKTLDDSSDNKETPDKKKLKKKILTPLPQVQDYYFKDFRKLCMNLSQENSYLQKTAIFKEFIDKMLSKGMFCVS